MLRRTLRLIGAAALAVPVVVGCNGPSGSDGANLSVKHALARQPSTGFAASGKAAPCGWKAKAGYRHVIWIWMENRSYGQILGRSGGAEHLASYARKCGTATNYDAIRHPSLPNYIAATSGSTHGISSDCGPADCPVPGRSVFSQLDRSGAGWAAYAESMKHRCDRDSNDRYAARHNPPVYYRALRGSCLAHDRKMGGPKGRFARHLAAGRLPGFTFVAPNLCDDGHDCSTATSDAWLGYWLGRITASPVYRAGRTVVFVTWDENDYSAASNQVATVVIAPTVKPGTRSHRHFTHYSLLRTTESLLHLRYLRGAATATDMRSAFDL
ncbi:MAG TPA: alkaline phosphatase family protein [Mycobacteriales bacterium]|nr:alkaline phosphatase family protein [Mycobacteriales bacterium]